VCLVLRGVNHVVPRPDSVSIMWVISHPELLSADECARYDRVFAASSSWSAKVTDAWGIAVHPLLQCTDAELFDPRRAVPDTGDDIVFVGNTRTFFRPAVRYVVEAGASPVLYGSGWDAFVPKELVRAEFLPNAEVPAVYGSAGLVLNDHWEDMRRDGFISNRVFDVLAVGGRLLTDDVAGLDELFGSAVQVFRSGQDVARLLTGDRQGAFPDLDERRRIAERVRAEHSFDSRARSLLHAALEVHGQRPVTSG
jgi:Glycosyl transferases group 1